MVIRDQEWLHTNGDVNGSFHREFAGSVGGLQFLVKESGCS
ncbi:MAG: hypothetical protein NTV68_10630 [Methanomicrobiales archaeon]|nr:hypothetical protein [Methanomicrobiales archaeon]